MITFNFPHKVIFSGEGSDEIFCGYLYFHNAPSPEDAHQDSLRLVDDLYKYDVLRADRCTAGNGLEFREPFLDKDLVNFVRNIPGEFKAPSDGFEKTILRLAFTDCLPSEIVWRRKAAFSDAVSGPEKPWYKWIQEFAQTKAVIDFGGTVESNLYRTLFSSYFKDYKPEIPLWLPRWSNVGQEPSATVIENIYKASEHS
jgi:asparagine synthase (glutamine-hydrolysing)